MEHFCVSPFHDIGSWPSSGLPPRLCRCPAGGGAFNAQLSFHLMDRAHHRQEAAALCSSAVHVVRCAPFLLHCICCFFTIRLLITRFTADSTNAVVRDESTVGPDISPAFSQRFPQLGSVLRFAPLRRQAAAAAGSPFFGTLEK